MAKIWDDIIDSKWVKVVLYILPMISAILITYYFYQLASFKNLSCELIEENSFPASSGGAFTYNKDEGEYKSISLLRYKISNSGARGIKGDDLLNNISFTLSDNSSFFSDPRFENLNPKNIEVSLLKNDLLIKELKFDLLDKGESFDIVFNILSKIDTIEYPDIRARVFEGSFTIIQKNEKNENPYYFNFSNISLKLLDYLILLVSLFYLAISIVIVKKGITSIRHDLRFAIYNKRIKYYPNLNQIVLLFNEDMKTVEEIVSMIRKMLQILPDAINEAKKIDGINKDIKELEPEFQNQILSELRNFEIKKYNKAEEEEIVFTMNFKIKQLIEKIKPFMKIKRFLSFRYILANIMIAFLFVGSLFLVIFILRVRIY